MDLACWRNQEAYIIRIFGSEWQLAPDEWRTLRMLMNAIDDGKDEALASGYRKLIELEEQSKEAEAMSLHSLGLLPKRERMIRRI